MRKKLMILKDFHDFVWNISMLAQVFNFEYMCAGIVNKMKLHCKCLYFQKFHGSVNNLKRYGANVCQDVKIKDCS